MAAHTHISEVKSSHKRIMVKKKCSDEYLDDSGVMILSPEDSEIVARALLRSPKVTKDSVLGKAWARYKKIMGENV